MGRIHRLDLSEDSMGGGAWPFLVSGAICLVNSDNERDSIHLNRIPDFRSGFLLRGTVREHTPRKGGHNRSVMPLDVLGRTRATLNIVK